MGALDGLLVIAIEQAVAAPLCTLRLADAGARVIKIERIGGETARGYDETVQGVSAYFTWLNRGKESVILDLKGNDLTLLKAMLARADVLVQNLAPGALDRLGLGNDVLAQEYPKLISLSILGYGQDTSYASMKAYDLLVQAESGVCSMTGTPSTPSKVGVPVTDIATGSNAHAAILEALIERGITGRGKQITMSMFDTMAEWMTVPLLHFEQAGLEAGRHGMAHATIYPYGPFECADGTLLLAIQTHTEWVNLCETVLCRPDLIDQSEFATNPQRMTHRALLDAEINPIFASMTLTDAKALCDNAKVAWGVYRDVKDLADHPALQRLDVPLENGAMIPVPRPAGRDQTFKAKSLPALGQHTASVRKEFS